jgi:DNA-binding protein HU-beta
MSKSELIQRIVEGHPNEIARKDVKGVIEAVAEIGYKELKKTGAFVMPGLAKFIVIKKPATKARQGINPFTKEPTVFKAKPARKIVRARPVKAAKDAVAWRREPRGPGIAAGARASAASNKSSDLAISLSSSSGSRGHVDGYPARFILGQHLGLQRFSLIVPAGPLMQGAMKPSGRAVTMSWITGSSASLGTARRNSRLTGLSFFYKIGNQKTDSIFKN